MCEPWWPGVVVLLAAASARAADGTLADRRLARGRVDAADSRAGARAALRHRHARRLRSLGHPPSYAGAEQARRWVERARTTCARVLHLSAYGRAGRAGAGGARRSRRRRAASSRSSIGSLQRALRPRRRRRSVAPRSRGRRSTAIGSTRRWRRTATGPRSSASARGAQQRPPSARALGQRPPLSPWSGDETIWPPPSPRRARAREELLDDGVPLSQLYERTRRARRGGAVRDRSASPARTSG